MQKTLCSVHVSYNNKIYIQINNVAMGSPLGPAIVNKWRRFEHDTFVYLKNGSDEYVLLVLNSFHENINLPM